VSGKVFCGPLLPPTEDSSTPLLEQLSQIPAGKVVVQTCSPGALAFTVALVGNTILTDGKGSFSRTFFDLSSQSSALSPLADQ